MSLWNFEFNGGVFFKTVSVEYLKYLGKQPRNLTAKRRLHLNYYSRFDWLLITHGHIFKKLLNRGGGGGGGCCWFVAGAVAVGGGVGLYK